MRRRAFLVPSLVVVGIGGLGVGPSWTREYLKKRVHVEIAEASPREKPRPARSAVGRAAERVRQTIGAIGADELHVRLRVRNNTPLPARIRAARYLVRIGGREVGMGVWVSPGGPQWFHPGRPVEIVASLDPDWAALATAGVDKATGHAAPISVSGAVTVAFLGDFTVPFEVSRVGFSRGAP